MTSAPHFNASRKAMLRLASVFQPIASEHFHFCSCQPGVSQQDIGSPVMKPVSSPNGDFRSKAMKNFTFSEHLRINLSAWGTWMVVVQRAIFIFRFPERSNKHNAVWTKTRRYARSDY